uniref:Citrate synthase n=1 Tax=Colletotrichum fructicola (strain Nara gc5) TaxID=1213859 RepID=L2GCP4_COLFN
MVTTVKNAPRGATPAPRQSLTVVDNRTGKSYELPITHNSVQATDIKKIKAARGNDRAEDETDQGLRVYDPAYMNTAVVQSNITYINGQDGILRYRGYPIQQLVNKSHFLESAFLLIYGELPTSTQYSKWQDEIMHHTYIHSDIEGMFKSFRYDTHPMAMLQSSFSALGAFAPESNPSLQGQKLYTNAASGDPEALKMLDKQILRIIGKAPTLAAASYRMRQGRPFNRPAQGLSYTGNFLYLLDHLSGHEYQPHPVLEKALDALFIIHADHEVNCSTATVLQVGSSLVDPPENVPAFMAKVEKRERVLVGFGHRVYKNVDPRSTAIRQLAEEVFAVTGRNQLLDTALELAKYARESEFMKKRNLYPNVDFYSGLIYQAMGFPLDFYPVLFAVPRCLYIGEGEREYVDAAQRKERENKSVFDEPVQVSHGGDSKRNELATYKDEMGQPWRGRAKL